MPSAIDGRFASHLLLSLLRFLRPPGPAGETVAGTERLGVSGAGHPFPYRQQRGVLVAGRSRVPGLPGPAGQVAADVEGTGVLGTQDSLEHRQSDPKSTRPNSS